MAQNRNGKVIKYRRAPRENIGIAIFFFIGVYIIICVVNFFGRKHISSYEVVEGSLSTTTVYTGIALRDEEIVSSQGDGYVNYFASEGGRCSAYQLIYSIDGSGRLADILANMDSETILNNNDLKELRNDCISFSFDFSPSHFEKVYTFKNSMESTIAQLSGNNTLESIVNITDSTISNSVNMYYAPISGIVEYYVDGFEGLTPADISADSFDQSLYNRKILTANMLLEEGDPCYKLSTSEEWKLVIPLDEEKVMELKDESYIKVKFLRTGTESWGSFSISSNADGSYGVLTFNNSMITFADERFVDIELILDENTGLKIPVSSIAEKEFYIIPAEYVFPSDTFGGKCVFKRIYSDDDGGLTWDKVKVTVYSETEDSYYIGEDSISGGDVLSKPDSEQEYTVSDRGTLLGVYNINKGYADFREVVILFQNDSYAIVKPNSYYGLTEYDHIVLDADTIDEDDFVY